MTEFSWHERVADLGAMLGTVEEQLKRGDPRPAELAEFKSALDDLRLRAWGLLMAANSEDPHAFQESFRAHRGIDFCRALTTDLQSGKLSATQPDLPALGAAAKDLSGVVKDVTGKPAKRRR